MAHILWKLGGFLLASTFRLLPRRQRFAAAIHAARLLQPLIRLSSVYAFRIRMRTDGIREISLDLVLMMLTRHGVLYEPRVRFIGGELLPQPGDTRATLIAGAHTMLGMLIARRIVDRGIDPAIISTIPFRISGTRKDAHVIVPSRTIFVTVRDLFAAAATVMATIDRADVERRSRNIATTRGEFVISVPLLELALRQDARILFFAATISDDWMPTLTLIEPPRTPDTTLNELLDELARVLDEHVHTR